MVSVIPLLEQYSRLQDQTSLQTARRSTASRSIFLGAPQMFGLAHGGAVAGHGSEYTLVQIVQRLRRRIGRLVDNTIHVFDRKWAT
jgi:hypothetical protein